jgi:Mn2+-dependent serine/threonine protein kinase
VEISLPPLRELLNEKVLIVSANKSEIIPLLSNLMLLSMGAEAYIFKARFIGVDAIVKWRSPKSYMPRDLDEKMRRSRTKLEAKILWKALSLGIRVPIPLFIDLDAGVLIMSYIEGKTLRDIAEEIPETDLCQAIKTVGSYTATLHMNGIAHGDLTTSNIIVANDGVYLIDFGLATFTKRSEDMAIDVHIFFRSIESTHHKVEDVAKKCFVVGYRQVAGDTKTEALIKAVNSIRLRGRYVATRRLRTEWVV